MASKGAIGAMYERAVKRVVSATNQMAGILEIPVLNLKSLSGKHDELRHAKELEMIADYLERVAAVIENSLPQQDIQAAAKAPAAKKGR